MTTQHKDTIILSLSSCGFKAHLITAQQLEEHATQVMGEPDAEQFMVLNDYVTTNLEDYDTVGWTEFIPTKTTVVQMLANLEEFEEIVKKVMQ